ncbi:AMP-dependent synthetase [Enterobacter sp.]|uniref:AMP-dependent synthetase n=1 Tax=Enterobacter sp. TaxID=42895 RepID=UPI00296E9A8B|nr:AMP-dependent synthetase [Enterobacter sp.]
MMLTLPLAHWLTSPRPNETPIAWLGDHIWTLGQLRHDVAHLVAALQQQDGVRWALCAENSYLFLVALLAALHAGKTPVIPGHSRESLLNEQRTLFDGVLSDRPLDGCGPVQVVTSSGKSVAGVQPLPAIDPHSHVELFTSGSTGHPQRIVKPIASLDCEASLLAARFADRLAGCRVIGSVAPLHLYGLTFRIFLPMSLGLPLHAAMIQYAEQLAALDSQQRYAFISSPAFLKRLDDKLTPPPVEMLLSAGGMLPWQDAVQTAAWLHVWPDEIYGSTETGVLAWRHRLHDDAAWLPFPGVQITAEGEHFRAISPLIPAENGLLLDDILHFNQDGTFQLAGRHGRVVKIEEKRISLNEIEQRLRDLDGVCDAAALAVTRHGRQSIGALLVLDAVTREKWQHNAGALELSWRAALRPWLEPVAVPRYWRIIKEIPVNSMNKRVYAHLQELFHETA